MTNPRGGLPFYPAGWHALVALVVQLSGATIPAAINAVTLVVSAVAWPLGILLLTRTLFGRSPVLAVSAGLLAASLPVFPILLMDYGVLYPYQLGLAPASRRAGRDSQCARTRREAPRRRACVVGGCGPRCLPGLALAHPGAFGRVARPDGADGGGLRHPAAARRADRSRSLAARRIVRGVPGGGRRPPDMLRPPLEARRWPLQMRMCDAIWDLLTISAWYQVPAVLAAIAVIAGIVWAIVARTARAWVVLGMYTVVRRAVRRRLRRCRFRDLRDALTGGWYNNLPRLAAILPIVLVPLGAYGVACTWAWIARRRRVRRIDGATAALGGGRGSASSWPFWRHSACRCGRCHRCGWPSSGRAVRSSWGRIRPC